MNRRFFVAAPISGPRARLEGAEAEHLAKVLRGRVGDEVILFDGGGSEFAARVLSVARATVELAVLTATAADRELQQPLILGVALPKGDRQRWLVEKAVELGVTRLVPLETARGVAQPTSSALGRLRRVVIEASKQCGRNRLMEVSEPRRLTHMFASAPAESARLIAHPAPTAQPLSRWLRDGWTGPVWVAVGPEGGFSDEEIDAVGSDGQLVSLGPRILRIETAAVALAAAVAMRTLGG